MRKLRVLALMDESLVPPDNIEGVSDEDMLDWKSEYDVVTTLGELNHDVMKLGVSGDLGVLTKALLDYKPQIIFKTFRRANSNALGNAVIVLTPSTMTTGPTNAGTM